MSPLMEFSYISLWEVVLRLGSAAGLAFLLGLDREIRQKAFGLRTHMLLCIGTAAFVIILMELTYSIEATSQIVEIDPARVIQGVIIGIGFLSAGAIVQSNRQIKGATTGAGIWILGAIGLACGLGLYLHAAVVTGLVLSIFVLLLPLDRWIEGKKGGK